MKLLGVAILIFLFSCKKENDDPVPQAVQVDSLREQFYVKYFLDLDVDGERDLELFAQSIPLQVSIHSVKAIPLHADLSIHTLSSYQDYCTDTIFWPANSFYTVTGNCNGSNGTVTETDSFYTSPNLSLQQLSNTQVALHSEDTLTLYYYEKHNAMPSPEAKFIEKKWGFFNGIYEGYLLVSLHSKRYGIKLAYPHILSLQGIIQIDP